MNRKSQSFKRKINLPVNGDDRSAMKRETQRITTERFKIFVVGSNQWVSIPNTEIRGTPSNFHTRKWEMIGEWVSCEALSPREGQLLIN